MNENRFSHQQLIEQASLTNEDFEQVAECRRNYNRLGFGYQVGFVHLLNRFPVQQPFEIIDGLLTFISIQLSIDSSEIDKYTLRQQTISQHQRKILQYLNKKEFVDADIASLERFIFEQCCRLEQTSVLLSLVEQHLKEQNILQPATRTLRRLIGEQRKLARQHIYEKITCALSEETKQKIDLLLEVEENSFSPLQQIKEPPRSPSPNAMRGAMRPKERTPSANSPRN